jgi:hypothetical protein
MDQLTPEAAATFLEQYAVRLSGMSSLKWTGEFGPAQGVEARLLHIASALRRGKSGTFPGLGPDDAQFLRGQAESLRSPNRLVLDDPMETAEWRQASLSAFDTAERLEAVADLLERKKR